MKKSLLLFFSTAMTGLFLQAQTVQRTVLVEEFTNASCPPCAAQNPAFNALLDQNTSKAVSIKYQTDWPGFDPFNAQNPAEVDVRVAYYGVTGVPNGFVNGVAIPNDCNAYVGAPACLNQAEIDAAYANPAKLGMVISHTLSNDLSTISVEVKITNPDTINEFNVADARLRVGIIEQVVEFASAPGTNGEQEFSNVMRKMLPDAAGILIGAIQAGETVTFNWTVPVPSYIYNYTQIGVVGFAQANGSKEVYQAAISVPQPLPGDFPDAAFSSATEPNDGLCDSDITPSVTVTNEGGVELTSFDVSYAANGSTPVVKNWTGSIMPGASETIDFDVLTLNGGETVIAYELSNINGGVVDINTLNNDVAAEAYYVISADPIGHELIGDMEDAEAEGAPSNSIVSRADILDLMVVNQDWLQSQGVTANSKVGGYAQSDNSIMCAFYITPADITSTLTFEKLDFSLNTEDSLSFDVAYRQYSSENDRLEIFVSTDCGQTWTSVYDKAGDDLETVGSATAFYVPTATQWRTDIVDLSDFDGESEVIVQFAATSQFGNNMYLDNINIGGKFMSAVEDAILNGNISVFPNPAASVVNVAFNMVKSNTVSVQVYDVAGKLVTTLVDNQVLAAGTHNVQWNNPANTGMYFVKIRTEEGETTQKVSVQK